MDMIFARFAVGVPAILVCLARMRAGRGNETEGGQGEDDSSYKDREPIKPLSDRQRQNSSPRS